MKKDVRVESGNLFFFFAYDIGFDINLGEAAALCRGVESPGITGSRPAPAHLQYRRLLHAAIDEMGEEIRRKAGADRWESTIRDQLRMLEDIYTVLNNRAAAGRAEMLETIIIVLIVIEIVMGLFRH